MKLGGGRTDQSVIHHAILPETDLSAYDNNEQKYVCILRVRCWSGQVRVSGGG